MDSMVLQATRRAEEPLGQLRKGGLVPGVVYGKDAPAQPIKVDARSLRQALHQRLLTLDLDGRKGTVVLKEVQRHPVNGELLHVDFQFVSMSDRIETKVPIQIVGESEAVRNGGILQHQLHELAVACRADAIPDVIEVSIADLGMGDARTVGDVEPPSGVEILNEPGEVICSIVAPRRAGAAAEEEAPEEMEQPEEPEGGPEEA